jgi:hypothetical protein
MVWAYGTNGTDGKLTGNLVTKNKSNGRRCVYNIKKDLKETEIAAFMWSVKGACNHISKPFVSVTDGKFRITEYLDMVHHPVL